MFASCTCDHIVCWPKGFSSKWRTASTRRHSKDSTDPKVKTATGHFKLSKKRRRSLCWLGWLVLTKGKIGLVLHTGGKKGYAWNIWDPLRCVLVLLCPVNKVNGNPRQFSSGRGRTTNGPDSSGMKVWVTSPSTSWGAWWRQREDAMESGRM